jgi:D-inositol-3-phosphate glycosyltransferase
MISAHNSPLDQPGIGDAGGMNTYIRQLALALAQLGAEVVVFTRAVSAAAPEVVLAPGVTVRHIAAGPFEDLDEGDLPDHLHAMTRGILQDEASRETGHYDLVHSHYWLSGQVGSLVADHWGVPLVHTMHSLARVENALLDPGAEREPTIRETGEEKVVAAAHRLIANTADEAADLIGRYGADSAKVVVIHPGVETAVFTPGDQAAARLRAGLDPTESLVVFVGRIQALKGPDVLVEALARLRARGGYVPRLLISGGSSGNPTALQELQELVRQVGVGDRVEFRPPVSRTELADLYRAADVVAVPSRSESFGLVAAEAMCAGAAVAAADVGGLRHVLADGTAGRLVLGHDPDTWADALSGLLADPAERDRLSRVAAAQSDRFSWRRAAEEMLQVYQQLG